MGTSHCTSPFTLDRILSLHSTYIYIQELLTCHCKQVLTLQEQKENVRLQEIRRYTSISSPTSPSCTLPLTDNADAILTSKYNKPFPVTLLPSAIGYYLGLKQGERQAQLLREIQALDIHDHEKVKYISQHPK